MNVDKAGVYARGCGGDIFWASRKWVNQNEVSTRKDSQNHYWEVNLFMLGVLEESLAQVSFSWK